MNPKAVAVSLAAAAVTTWATNKIVKGMRVPAVAAPLVGSAVGMAVNRAMRRLR
ncbi:MAG TPA: hypothetical protein VNV66_12955 [Pilimelia sp.]|nr:hypothetical protein [Pilimelia sp.]